jgi:hypothetical protein
MKQFLITGTLAWLIGINFGSFFDAQQSVLEIPAYKYESVKYEL